VELPHLPQNPQAPQAGQRWATRPYARMACPIGRARCRAGPALAACKHAARAALRAHCTAATARTGPRPAPRASCDGQRRAPLVAAACACRSLTSGSAGPHGARRAARRGPWRRAPHSTPRANTETSPRCTRAVSRASPSSSPSRFQQLSGPCGRTCTAVHSTTSTKPKRPASTPAARLRARVSRGPRRAARRALHSWTSAVSLPRVAAASGSPPPPRCHGWPRQAVQGHPCPDSREGGGVGGCGRTRAGDGGEEAQVLQPRAVAHEHEREPAVGQVRPGRQAARAHVAAAGRHGHHHALEAALNLAPGARAQRAVRARAEVWRGLRRRRAGGGAAQRARRPALQRRARPALPARCSGACEQGCGRPCCRTPRAARAPPSQRPSQPPLATLGAGEGPARCRRCQQHARRPARTSAQLSVCTSGTEQRALAEPAARTRRGRRAVARRAAWRR